MRSKACIDWAVSADTPGRRSLEWTSTDGQRARDALMSTTGAKCHDVVDYLMSAHLAVNLLQSSVTVWRQRSAPF